MRKAGTRKAVERIAEYKFMIVNEFNANTFPEVEGAALEWMLKCMTFPEAVFS